MPSATMTKDNKRGSKPPKHWTQRVHACDISRDEGGSINIAVKGGAENGLFPFISDIRSDRILVRNGKLHIDDILLEVNEHKLAGYTLWDIEALFKHLGDVSFHLKLVKPGQTITKDLRRYLNMRFQKGSIDHDLQSTIRENLYVRTVPCTTRTPRDEELDGVDYKFLSVDEFMALEKSGHLLESGIFEGNHYGTPKPPQYPPNQATNPQHTEEAPPDAPSKKSGDHRPGARPSSSGKRTRNKSTIEATTLNATPVDEAEEKKREEIDRLTEELGVLPSNWEIAFTEQGDMYFIDHVSAATQWLDPRLESKQKQELLECEDDELPYGWEKIDDPQYGTYFIDHINRKTQYENPVVKAKAAASQSASTLPHPNKKAHTSPQRVHSESDLPKYGNGTGPAPVTTSDTEWKAMFTKNPAELKGEKIISTLSKSNVGFGFTIVGGDDAEEFLQIKSVVPNGPAYKDGVLKTGDVLVHVNDTLVLGYTHHEVVGMFQTVKPGQKVKLEVCRGYPLPFDPDDPNTSIVTTYANMSLPNSSTTGSIKATQSFPEKLSNNVGPPSHASSNDVETASRSSRNSSDHPNSDRVKSLPDLTAQSQQESDMKVSMQGVNLKPALGLPNDRESVSSDQTTDSLSSVQTETHTIIFVKGIQGFGFTVADSPFGQKVKQILAPQRCKTLREGDILVAINNEYIRDMPHNAVVQKLKECPQGQETAIMVQRGGMLKPVRNISKNKSASSKNSQPADIPKLERSTSDHSLSSTHRIQGPNHRDDDLKSSSDEFERRSQDDMRRLKRNRNRDKERLSPAHEKGEKNKDGKPKSPDIGHDRQNGRYHESDRESEDRHSHHSDREKRHQREWEQGSNKSPESRLHDHERKLNHVNKLEADIQHASQDAHRRREHLRPEYAQHSPQRDPRGGGHERRAPDRRPYEDHDHRNDRRVNNYDTRSLERPRGSRPSDPHRRGPPQGEQTSRTLDRRRPKTPNYDSRSLPPDEIRKHNPRFPHEWHDDLKYYNSKGETGRGRSSKLNNRDPSTGHKQDDSLSRRPPSRGRPKDDVDSNSIETTVFLKKHADGFGFRIVGGHEEGSQVSIGTITPGGAADVDGRLITGDDLLYVDGKTVVGASHRKVVNLMKDANEAGRVSLGIRRITNLHAPEKIQQPSSQPVQHLQHQQRQQPQQLQHQQQQPQQLQPQQLQHQQPQQQQQHIQQCVQPARVMQVKSQSGGAFPYKVTLTRKENEGFGFVILSSTLKSGSKIGRIIPGSPADRSPSVNVGDRLIAVNSIDITMLNHRDIINIIKDTGVSVTLTIAAPEDSTSPNSPKGSEPMFSAMAMPAHVKTREQQQHTPNQGSPYHLNAMQRHTAPEQRRAEIMYAQPAQWRQPQEAEPRRYDTRQHQQPTPIPTHTAALPPSTNQFYRNPVQDQIDPGEYYSVELDRGPKGFGFSIRGGREYHNTPVFVLRMAIDGPAVKEGRMMVGDQLIEINGYSTDGMLHTEATEAIKNGGLKVRLLLRRSGKPPIMDVNVNPRRYTQTPPPRFNSIGYTVSGSNIRNYYDTTSDGASQEGFDHSWSYRSLPRGLKY